MNGLYATENATVLPIEFASYYFRCQGEKSCYNINFDNNRICSFGSSITAYQSINNINYDQVTNYAFYEAGVAAVNVELNITKD